MGRASRGDKVTGKASQMVWGDLACADRILKRIMQSDIEVEIDIMAKEKMMCHLGRIADRQVYCKLC